ncbi:TetR/AcrR family transcriptional regulator [Nocardia nova]|nr:TetR/AcrR family transcriptional regulator [Nocardia nova]
MVKIMNADADGDAESRGRAVRAYGGISAAERRERRRTALLDAALDLLAEGGASAVTKRAVCARARLNDRYFYEHFADRDVLVQALAGQLTADGIAAVISATLAAGPDLHEQVRAAADAALGFLAADPRRQALVLASHSDAALQSGRLSTQRDIAAAMAAVVRELRPPDPAAAPLDLDMTAYAVVSGTLELVAAWIRGEFRATRTHLTELIAALLLAGTAITPAAPEDR